jgi:hypothetical protein
MHPAHTPDESLQADFAGYRKMHAFQIFAFKNLFAFAKAKRFLNGRGLIFVEWKDFEIGREEFG